MHGTLLFLRNDAYIVFRDRLLRSEVAILQGTFTFRTQDIISADDNYTILEDDSFAFLLLLAILLYYQLSRKDQV